MSQVVGAHPDAGMAHASIQRAIDEAGHTGGGEVRLEPGVYRLEDSLHLRSDVRLIGGEGVFLTRAPSVASRLSIYCGYGLYEFAVEEPDRFRVGQGVHLTDDDSNGFYDTVGTIVGRAGDRFYLDVMLNHDYHPARNAWATALFPLISGVDASGAGVSGLTLDGNPEETRALNGCRGGGVFLLRSRRIVLEGLEVRNYRGDGISFQQCVDVTVRGCRVHHNTGSGLHPGSGSVRYTLEGNHLHDNGGCGIFYCLRTTHSLCRGNRIESNGDVGISIGEMDTDHAIEGNEIRGNSRHGVFFRRPSAIGGDRVRIERNRFGPTAGEAASHAIHLDGGVSDLRIAGNTFEADESPALHAGPGCRRIGFFGNRVGDRSQSAGDVVGDPEAVEWSDDAPFPAVGPAALPPDGARHLAIERL